MNFVLNITLHKLFHSTMGSLKIDGTMSIPYISISEKESMPGWNTFKELSCKSIFQKNIRKMPGTLDMIPHEGTVSPSHQKKLKGKENTE